MRYINKGKEPPSLTEYKKENNAYFDGYRNKDQVREALLKEQGYVCAYLSILEKGTLSLHVISIEKIWN